MTQEEKSLLLQDLSARLPYGIIVSVTDGTIKYKAYIESVSYKNIQVSPVSDSNFTAYTFYKISEIKPYLRPMSSMTNEEREEARELFFMNSDNFDIDDVGEIFTESQPFESVYTLSLFRLSNYIDWLNSRHFDYRGLIEKGLAIEAPEGIYK